MKDTQKYPVLMRLIHWLMAIGLLGLIASGWYMAGLDKSVSFKYDIYFWHKSFGVVALFTVALRILVRLISAVPALPDTIPGYEQKLARLAHFLLYTMMIAVPLSGFLMSDFGGRPVPLFNLTTFELLEDNKDLAGTLWQIHTTIPYIFLGIIALHIAGALKHRFYDKPENDVLKRML